ncbi:MAG: hypothetical protein JRI68_10715 [Deltaproteobacteria bacterium]|nr:hypothetical protein [Deltaproteobacteria bacterium]
MAPRSRNTRTKSPRPLAIDPRASSPNLRRAYLGLASPTPTPPPVAVDTAPAARAEAEPGEALAPIERKSRAGRIGFWALAVLLTVGSVASALGFRHLSPTEWIVPGMERFAAQQVAAPPTAQPQPTPATAKVETSGWRIKHDGYVPISGGVLLTPKTFAPSEEGYDLAIHFHGDVQIVHESYEHAGINAAVAVINLGVRSGVYSDHYAVPGTLEALLAQIDKGLRKRGVEKPKLRRLAFTAWSAGYGAIESILEHRRAPHAQNDPLDAILVLDGVHAGFEEGDPKRVKLRSVRNFVHAARAASEGQLMFSLTHSEIDPVEYASTTLTAAFLLKKIDAAVSDNPVLPLPPQLLLDAAKGAVKEHKRMIPTADTRVGMFRVQGFKGNTQDHHSAHLTQMASVGLPDLARRWASAAQDESTALLRAR